MVHDLVCAHTHKHAHTTVCVYPELEMQMLCSQIKSMTIVGRSNQDRKQQKAPPPLPLSPFCLCLILVLMSRWRPGLVHFRIEAIQLLRGGQRLAGHRPGACRGRRATDKCLRRRRLTEVVDAGVVGVTVIVFHLGEGGRRDMARVYLHVTRFTAEKRGGNSSLWKNTSLVV